MDEQQQDANSALMDLDKGTLWLYNVVKASIKAAVNLTVAIFVKVQFLLLALTTLVCSKWNQLMCLFY